MVIILYFNGRKFHFMGYIVNKNVEQAITL